MISETDMKKQAEDKGQFLERTSRLQWPLLSTDTFPTVSSSPGVPNSLPSYLPFRQTDFPFLVSWLYADHFPFLSLILPPFESLGNAGE